MCLGIWLFLTFAVDVGVRGFWFLVCFLFLLILALSCSSQGEYTSCSLFSCSPLLYGNPVGGMVRYVRAGSILLGQPKSSFGQDIMEKSERVFSFFLPIQYHVMITSLSGAFVSGLQPSQWFISPIVQLLTTPQLRHEEMGAKSRRNAHPLIGIRLQ